jgi:hypothetical protein
MERGFAYFLTHEFAHRLIISSTDLSFTLKGIEVGQTGFVPQPGSRFYDVSTAYAVHPIRPKKGFFETHVTPVVGLHR